MISQVAEIPVGSGNVERPMFLPIPEHIAPYLDHLKEQEIETQMRSVEGRQRLLEDLMRKSEEIKRDHNGSFHPELLQPQLEAAGEALAANDRYMEQIQEPENKGMFRRAWEAVKSFPRKHPVVTALLAAALVAGGVAAGFYFTGNWELLMSATGLSKILGGAEAAGELVPPTPATPPLSGGGVFDIPPPTTQPGGIDGPI